MTLLAVLVAALLTYGLGRLLLRRLGWPTDIATAGRWGMVLLGSAVVFAGFPELLRSMGRAVPHTPDVDLADVFAALCLIGLAAVGLVGWNRAVLERERQDKLDERARLMPRRRSLPPPPNGGVGATPDGFLPVGGGGNDAENDAGGP